MAKVRDIHHMNALVSGLLVVIENDYTTLDDADKRAVLQIAADHYGAKILRDTTVATVNQMFRG